MDTPTTPSLQDLEAHRAALYGHCYRMLGAASEAEDAVQEAMVRAWRGLARFAGRSSLRTWLYKIATRVCLDLLQERAKRAHPLDEGPAGTIHDALTERPRAHWLEPVFDAHAIPAEDDPARALALRQSVRLAFVVALQHLPPKQRAALLLAEVLDWSAAEIAEALETSVPAVNSALQRARATLATRDLDAGGPPLSPAEHALVARFVEAFERYDMDALSTLLHQDATMCMPPLSLWLRGPEAISAWMLGRGALCRGSRLLPVAANGSPAFAQYKPDPDGGFSPWSLTIVGLSRGQIASLTFFLDAATLFPRAGLPARL